MFCDLLDLLCRPKSSAKSKEDQLQLQSGSDQGEEEEQQQKNVFHHCQQPITNRHGLHRIYNEHLFNSFHGKLALG